LADRLGRKKMYGSELILIVFCTIASCFSADMKRGLPFWATLVFWRFLLGIGIGGDYPLSAVITSEFATTRRRGAMISAVFAMQGFGLLAASLVAAACLAAFSSVIDTDPTYLDYVWRMGIGIGVIPGVISIYFRLTMPETPRYKQEQANASEHEKLLLRGEPAPPVQNEFYRYFRQWRHLKILLGTAISWFCLDVAFYGINLNNSIILAAIGFSSNGDAYTQLMQSAVGNIVIALLGTVPGYWVSVFTIDRLGRRKIQIGGFAILTVLFLVLGCAFGPLLNTSVYLFVALFTLAQFFQNFGPNVTTFVIPGEVFPTRVRSTAHGISAASGKLGAIVAQVGFSQLKDIGGKNAFIGNLLIIFAVFMAIGCVVSFWIPETARRSLEEIEAMLDGNDGGEKPAVGEEMTVVV